MRRGATLKQLEHRLGELSSEKDVSTCPACILSVQQQVVLDCTLNSPSCWGIAVMLTMKKMVHSAANFV